MVLFLFVCVLQLLGLRSDMSLGASADSDIVEGHDVDIGAVVVSESDVQALAFVFVEADG